LRSAISTNGHLLGGSLFQQLISLQVAEFQTTLDGSRRYHNERRISRNSRGHYDRIVNNLFSMCDCRDPFALTLRIHVDRLNATSIHELFSDLGDIVSDKRVTVSFERVKYLGTKLPPNIAPMSGSEFVSFVSGIMSDYAGVINFDDVLAKIDTHVCYAALPNNFVIRADGRLQKCTVALNNLENTVGTLVRGGEISINDQYQKWLEVWNKGDSSLLACPARHVLYAQRA
jgi:uncharacterized protein